MPTNVQILSKINPTHALNFKLRIRSNRSGVFKRLLSVRRTQLDSIDGTIVSCVCSLEKTFIFSKSRNICSSSLPDRCIPQVFVVTRCLPHKEMVCYCRKRYSLDHFLQYTANLILFRWCPRPVECGHNGFTDNRKKRLKFCLCSILIFVYFTKCKQIVEHQLQTVGRLRPAICVSWVVSAEDAILECGRHNAVLVRDVGHGALEPARATVEVVPREGRAAVCVVAVRATGLG